MDTAFLSATSTASIPSSAASEAVSGAVLVYLLYRQRQARPLRTSPVFPLVLGAVGLLSVLSSARLHPLSVGQVVVVVALFFIDAIGLGAARAFTVQLWKEGRQVLRRASWLTVALWLIGIGAHEGALAAAHIDSSSLLLYLGLTLGAQRFVLIARARGADAGESHP